MSPTRRDFLRLSALAGSALGLGGLQACGGDEGAGDASPGAEQDGAAATGPEPKRILILGGTGFIGPHQVRYARERGHTLTLFNRGVTDPDAFPNVEQLRGDRAAPDYASLEGREWDFVIDNSATDPQWVRDATEVLAGNVGGYLFVSSTGVYYPYTEPNVDETHPPATEGDMEDGSAAYGINKARCEQVVMERFPDAGVVVRPHYIVGPDDPTDRWTHWPLRVRQGGEMLIPTASDPVQFVDVRDLTQWMIHLAEEGRSGIYNAPGPVPGTYTVGQMVADIGEVVDSDVTLTEVDSDFLVEQGVQYITPWVAMTGETLGMTRIDGSKAVAAGLAYRPVPETTADTLAWWDGLPQERRESRRPMLAPEDEARILEAWHARG